VAIRAVAGHLLVGPDNGLLWPATRAAGGAEAAVDLADSRFALDHVSATFHGRDVFAPVAAALADGAALETAGSPIDPGSLVALTPLEPQIDELAGSLTDLDAAGIAGDGVVLVDPGGGPLHVRVGRTFSDVAPGELLLYEDSNGALSLAVSSGSAARRLRVAAGDELRISPR
jgi:S-adenosylmethionine hydrolase